MECSEDMVAFVGKVMEMRRVQKEFFKTRSYAAMQLSKTLEKDVDDRAARLLRALSEAQEDAQPDLFGGTDA